MSFADRSAARRLRRTPTVEVLEDRLLMAGDDIFEENDTKAIVDARVLARELALQPSIEAAVAAYDEAYHQWRKLYPALKEFYQ